MRTVARYPTRPSALLCVKRSRTIPTFYPSHRSSKPKPYQKKIPIYLAGFAPKALERIISSNAAGWAGIPQLDLEGFKGGQEQLRKAAKTAGRDPNSIEFPVLVFPEVSESDLGDDRQLMNGSIEQIAQDLKEFENLGVDHVNLVFDFGTIATNLEKRLAYAKQIKDTIRLKTTGGEK